MFHTLETHCKIMNYKEFFLKVPEKGHMRLILQECEKQGALRNQAAYLLATAQWETNHTFEPVVEAYWLSENWRKRNLRYYPWHGRGFVQMTWEENYKRAARETGIPFDKKPELALVPEYAAVILVKGTLEGWWTGKRLEEFVNLRKSNFYAARRTVNGLDKARKIADLAKKYDKALLAAGYGVEIDSGASQESVSDVTATHIPETKNASQEASNSIFATLVEVGAKVLVEWLRKK
ncbi:hypothetical protein [Maritalea mediterranea]|uniref:Glycoside hydrolase family 19 catalytic domain-containing protein n=1 Tax=Maritalea mediterranea TaxID=2909667 RepID=A0ABS9E6V9_9HYPH|nr:hypothetical protein [Maritalea mediterranea]MCF4098606.1 hypothetical protein [Maritalea mediterranea]